MPAIHPPRQPAIPDEGRSQKNIFTCGAIRHYRETLIMGYFLLYCLISGLVGMAIGQGKGRVEVGFLFGILLGPIGWILVAIGPENGPKCPFCKETVKNDAIACKHCGRDILNQASTQPQVESDLLWPLSYWTKNRASTIAPMKAPDSNTAEVPTIYLLSEEQQTGPFTISEINERKLKTAFSPDTMYWREGMKEWRSITQL